MINEKGNPKNSERSQSQRQLICSISLTAFQAFAAKTMLSYGTAV
jgi:hypothetical protein